MKKKLTALLCTLCMAVTLCATAFATAAKPTMTATATLSEDKKQVTLELSLSGMDGNYTALQCDLDYNKDQITYNSAEKGELFDSLTVNDARTRMIWELKSGSMNDNGTVATVVFGVNDGVTGDIKIDVKNIKIAAYKEEGSLDTDLIKMDDASTSVTIAAPQPTTAPTAEPTAAPTAEPTAAPTAEPTAAPTAEPTAAPTAEPTTAPTAEPTNNPTTAPTQKPSSDKSDKNDKKPDSTAAAATAVPAAQTPASPKTGDTANLALYGVLGVACVVALGVVIYRRKKANH